MFRKQIEIPRTLPQEFRDEIASWPVVAQSPHSFSFYNITDKTWDHTPEGSLRISDHWNFQSRGRLNCPTDQPVSKGWSLGRWECGRYVILKTLPNRPIADYSDEEAGWLTPQQQERRKRTLQQREFERRKQGKS